MSTEQGTSARQSQTSQLWVHHPLGLAEKNCFVWLHGWGQQGSSFNRLAALLEDMGHHRLYDLPGFGATPLIDDQWGTADYGEALLDQLPEKPAIFIGHSFGARVAIRAAISKPKQIKALILIAGAGLRPKRSLYKRSRAFLLKIGSRAAGLIDGIAGTGFKQRYGARFGSSDYKAAGDLRTVLVKTVTEDLAPLAAQVTCPVLIITGSEDSETPPDMAYRYHQLFARSDVHIVKGFGHLDILSRGVYQCEALIRPFVEKL